MAEKTVTEVINYLKDCLLLYGIKYNHLALFGSQLKKTATGDSDIDLIIVSDEFENKDIFERSKITMKAEMDTLDKYMIPLDVLKLTTSEYQQAIRNMRYEMKIV